MSEDHVPIDYRPDWEDRTTIPADVCSTCSNFALGRLVPVSQCPPALAKLDELHAWFARRGPKPSWIPEVD